jgi:hypothetical protein
MQLRTLGMASLFGLVAGLVGCGSETPPAEESREPAAAASAAADGARVAPSPADVPPPTDIVSRFLDQIRRGGDQTDAAALMTSKARAECQRTGLVLQPIGSPETQFEVTRSERVPGSEDAALVHTLLVEPPLEGEAEPTSYQVVWALRREAEGWRISGLALEIEAGEEPLVVDFENGNDAARKLGVEVAADPADQPAVRQAAEASDPAVR